MKLNESFRFPHPVLTEGSDDYTLGRMELVVSVEEKPASGALTLGYQLLVDSGVIQGELDARTSRAYLSIVCRDAFYNELVAMATGVGEVAVGGGNLYGRVELRAIVARSMDGTLVALGANDEYGRQKFAVEEGDVLAWTEVQVISVGMDKLAPMESIFRLALDSEMAEGEFAVDYDQEYISIRAPEKLLATVHAMRGNSIARPVVLNAVYAPALMAVLDAFRDGSEFCDRRWYRVIQAKADHLGLDLSSGTALENGQRLLKLPAGRLTTFMERMP